MAQEGHDNYGGSLIRRAESNGEQHICTAGTLLFLREEASQCVYIVRGGNVALLWPDEEAAPMEIICPGTSQRQGRGVVALLTE
jgi:hypothetical protein